MIFNLAFPNNAILSRVLLSFLIIDLYFLIRAVIAQFYNTTELQTVMPIGIPTKKEKQILKLI